jgi:hypothetical protein
MVGFWYIPSLPRIHSHWGTLPCVSSVGSLKHQDKKKKTINEKGKEKEEKRRKIILTNNGGLPV